MRCALARPGIPCQGHPHPLPSPDSQLIPRHPPLPLGLRAPTLHRTGPWGPFQDLLGTGAHTWMPSSQPVRALGAPHQGPRTRGSVSPHLPACWGLVATLRPCTHIPTCAKRLPRNLPPLRSSPALEEKNRSLALAWAGEGGPCLFLSLLWRPRLSGQPVGLLLRLCLVCTACGEEDRSECCLTHSGVWGRVD